MSHSTETFRRGTLQYVTNFWYGKIFCLRGLFHDFLSKLFLSHSTEKLRRRTLLCFTKFLVLKNVRDERGGEYHDFLSKLFCFTVPKHFAGEYPLVFTFFWYRKIFCFRGLCQDFLSKLFLSHSTEKLRRRTLLCFTKFLVLKNVRDERGGEYHDFLSKLFCFTVPKHFAGEYPLVFTFFWYRKIFCFRGLCQDFLSKLFLSHSTEKLRRRTLLCFTKFLVLKNVRDERGGEYHDFLSKLFCFTVPKHVVEEPFCVSESFGYRKILCLRRGDYHDFR